MPYIYSITPVSTNETVVGFLKLREKVRINPNLYTVQGCLPNLAVNRLSKQLTCSIIDLNLVNEQRVVLRARVQARATSTCCVAQLRVIYRVSRHLPVLTRIPKYPHSLPASTCTGTPAHFPPQKLTLNVKEII